MSGGTSLPGASKQVCPFRVILTRKNRWPHWPAHAFLRHVDQNDRARDHEDRGVKIKNKSLSAGDFPAPRSAGRMAASRRARRTDGCCKRSTSTVIVPGEISRCRAVGGWNEFCRPFVFSLLPK
jgi:hypothetical protein